MTFTRRETLAVGGAALAVAALPAKLMASTSDLIAGVTGGRSGVSRWYRTDGTRNCGKWEHSASCGERAGRCCDHNACWWKSDAWGCKVHIWAWLS